MLSEFDFAVPLSSPPKEKAPKPKKKKKTKNPEDLGSEIAEDDNDEDEEDADEDEEMEEGEDAGAAETRKLEQAFLLKGLQAAQVRDLAEATAGSHAQRSLLSRLELEIDKTLLQLLAAECREGEERGMRALEMVELMRDRTGRMMEAAGKVAERYGRTILGEKIREVGEKRVSGEDAEDDF